jgi:hypothetical protein
MIVQDTATDAQHHRPVPQDEHFERQVVAAAQETVQQLGVRRAPRFVEADAAA